MSKTRQKRERNSGLHISVREHTAGKNRIWTAVNLSAPVLLLYLGTAWSLLSVFELPSYTWWAVLPGVVLLLLLLAGGRIRKCGYVITGVLFLVTLGLILGKQTPVYQGLLLACNDATKALGQHTEILLEGYQVSAATDVQPLCYQLFTGICGIFLAAVCYSVTESKKNGVLFLLLLPVGILALVCGMGAKSWPILILLLGAILTMNTSFLRGSRQKTNATVGSSGAFLQVAVWTAVFFVGAAVLLQVAVSKSGYQKLGFVSGLQEKVQATIQELRYEKEPVSSFNQGQFDKLGDLKLTDKEALKVVMDEPTSMYLRGFIGSTYTSTGWEETEGKELYEKRELFYWLHRTDFNGLTQMATLYGLENPDKKEESVQVTVQNVNGNSKYLYTPYELMTEPQSLEDVRNVGDERLQSEKFMGSRVYTYQAAGNLVKQYPQIASGFYSEKDSEEFKTYTEDESYYNSFVYEQYTEIPLETELLLGAHLNVERRSGQNHASYEEANTLITAYLNKNLKYSEKITPLQSGDFLKNLLEVRSQGYSVHYATAATMMYRYLGIPARYVEGYLVTPKLVADTEDYEEISITGKQAHAWVEIYQDGIGWVPMEVTPPYFDVMERPDYEIVADGGIGDEGQEGSAEDGQSQNVQDKTPDVPEEQTKSKDHDWKKWLLAGALILVFLALLALVGYVIVRRWRLRTYLREIRQADHRRAVCLLGQYMVRWLCYVKLWDGNGSRYQVRETLEEKFGEELSQRYQRAIDVIQLSAYSDAEITSMERQETEAVVHDLQSRILHTVGIRQKLRMKFIDFLY